MFGTINSVHYSEVGTCHATSQRSVNIPTYECLILLMFVMFEYMMKYTYVCAAVE